MENRVIATASIAAVTGADISGPGFVDAQIVVIDSFSAIIGADYDADPTLATVRDSGALLVVDTAAGIAGAVHDGSMGLEASDYLFWQISDTVDGLNAFIVDDAFTNANLLQVPNVEALFAADEFFAQILDLPAPVTQLAITSGQLDIWPQAAVDAVLTYTHA